MVNGTRSLSSDQGLLSGTQTLLTDQIKLFQSQSISKLQTPFISKTKDNDLEIFKIQVDDIILPWVTDRVPMYWWVPMS